jgi:hypothetical protein
MNKPALLLLVTFFLTPLFAAVQPPPDPFEDFMNRAKQMGETPEGKAYEAQIGDTLAKALQDSLKERTKDTKPPYAVRLVFIIAQDGSCGTIGHAEGDALSTAVAKDLNGIKFAAPPKAGWMVAVEIKVKE